MLIDGVEIDNKNPSEAINNGYVLVSEDRKRYGLVLLMNVKENITLGSLNKVSNAKVLDENKEIHETNKYMDMFRIKAPDFSTKTMNLSGGNQQKVQKGISFLRETFLNEVESIQYTLTELFDIKGKNHNYRWNKMNWKRIYNCTFKHGWHTGCLGINPEKRCSCRSRAWTDQWYVCSYTC